ncbi:Uncharacterised protein [Segatella copri]|nr:Uncharacterised protein [Segatella copri]
MRVLLVTCTIIFSATISLVSCLIHGRADTVVTGCSIRETEFQVRQPVLCIYHPRLLCDTPTQCGSREVAPTVVLHELRRTIGTHSECQQIAVCIRVVQTAEERKSTIFLTQ